MSNKDNILLEIKEFIEFVRYESNMAEGNAQGLDDIAGFDPEDITLDDVENFQSVAEELRDYAENIIAALSSLATAVEERDEDDEEDDEE